MSSPLEFGRPNDFEEEIHGLPEHPIGDTPEVTLDGELMDGLGDSALRGAKMIAPDARETRAVTEFLSKAEGPYFEQVLATEPRVNVEGDTPQDRDAVLARIATKRLKMGMEDSQRTSPLGVGVVLHFSPQATSHLVRSMDPEVTQVARTCITDSDGVFSVLTPQQVVEVIATAASGDREPIDGHAYRSTLRQVVTTLARDRADGSTPSLSEIRAGVDVLNKRVPAPQTVEVVDNETGQRQTVLSTLAALGGDTHEVTGSTPPRPGEITALDPAMQTQVADCIPPEEQARNQEVYAKLADYLGSLLQETPDPAIPDLVQPPTQEPIDVSGTFSNEKSVVLNFEVPVTAYGSNLRAARIALIRAAVPLLAQQTPWGKPAFLVVADADEALSAAGEPVVTELFRLCERQHIPLMVSIANVTDRSVLAVQDGAHAILRLDPAERAVLSRALGTRMRDDVSGISHGFSFNEGVGGHTGMNTSYRLKAADPDNSGGNISKDETLGASYNISGNTAVGEGPAYRPADLAAIGKGVLAIVDSEGNAHGLFSVRQGRRVGEFPPKQPEIAAVASLETVAKRAANIAERLATERLTMETKGSPLAIAGSQDGENIPRPAMPTQALSPQAQRQNDRMDYRVHYGKSPSEAELDTYVRARRAHDAELARGITKETHYPTWLAAKLAARKAAEQARRAERRRTGGWR